MTDKLLPPEYKDWMDGELTKEEIEQMRAHIEEEINERIGPLVEIVDALDDLTPEAVERLEQIAAEYADSWIGDWVLDKLGAIEVKGGAYCEIQ